MKKWLVIVIVVFLVGGLLTWVLVQSAKPLPGQEVADLGRKHVDPGTKLDYNSNPPTSGPHYTTWVTKGVYDTVKQDGYLVHSLEHGYVVISYNCNFKPSGLIPTAYAQAMNAPTASELAKMDNATESAKLTTDFKSADCQQLVNQLKDIYQQKGTSKLIVVPRPSLDAKIALTAWRRIEKINSFDNQKITDFIDNFRNHGPEATIEP